MSADSNDKISQNQENITKKSKPISEKVDSFKSEQVTVTIQHPDGTIEKRKI